MTDRYEEAPIKKLAAFFYEDEIERLNGEIERLREALEELLPHALFLLTQMEDGLSKDPKLLRDRIQKARSALEEKE